MVQIIPNNEKRSFLEQILSGANEAIPGIQKHFDTQNQRQAMEKAGFGDLAGLDPDLAKALAVERLKGQRPEKPLTSLQQSQEELNRIKIKQAEAQEQLFNKFKGRNQQQQESTQNETEQPQSEEEALTQWPIDELKEIAAFKGQPGQQGILGNIASNEIERREKEEKENRKNFLEERKYHTEFAKETEKEANQLRTSLPKKEMALDFARNSIESGDVSYFSPDKLADATGMDLFRTAKGAQLLTAGKENLLSNMSRVGAKAQNIWFEQRLNSMFPKIGQSDEANLTVQEILEGETALDKAFLSEYEKIYDEDEKNYGFQKKDINKRVRNNIKPREKEILNRTSYRMKEIEEKETGLTKLKEKVGKNVVKGTPLTLAMMKLYVDKFGKDNALEVAQKNGYYIPTIEELNIFQQIPKEFRQGLQ